MLRIRSRVAGEEGGRETREEREGRDMSVIPVIDVEKLSSEAEECEKLREACEKWGCFRAMKHPVALSLMADVKMVVESLLDLPAEAKKRNSDVIQGSGYMAPSVTNPFYEALGLFDAASSQAVHHFCSQLDASPHQRQILETYGRATHELAEKIAQKMGESLGLSMSEDDFKDWPSLFRINKYNFTPQTVGQSGVQIHTDSAFLTILQDDETLGGLQVMDQSGCFADVPPLPGSFLVNLGDLAHAWSNGRFYNVKHRVECKEGRSRVSIAMFLLGPREGNVEAPAKLVDWDHPRMYRPITYRDYRNLLFSSNNKRAGETLRLLRTH